VLVGPGEDPPIEGVGDSSGNVRFYLAEPPVVHLDFEVLAVPNVVGAFNLWGVALLGASYQGAADGQCEYCCCDCCSHMYPLLMSLLRPATICRLLAASAGGSG
jgi:hypothetical protein